MKIIWPGCGSAFSFENFQSNPIIEIDNIQEPERLIVDFGGYAPLALNEMYGWGPEFR